jgi:hypothetical protein
MTDSIAVLVPAAVSWPIRSAHTGAFAFRGATCFGASIALLERTRAQTGELAVGLEDVNLKEDPMSNIKESLAKIMQLDGAVGTCVVDSNSGMMLGSDGGGGSINLEVAAAGNTEVVRAKRKTMKALNLKDHIEDILITLHGQYHLIRPLSSNDALFIYLVLDKQRGNLAMSRHQLAAIEKDLAI